MTDERKREVEAILVGIAVTLKDLAAEWGDAIDIMGNLSPERNLTWYNICVFRGDGLIMADCPEEVEGILDRVENA